MTQERRLRFHENIFQNNLNHIESVVYSIFSKKNEVYKQYWNKIHSLLLSSMKNANVNSFQRYAFWFYINKIITKGLKNGIPLIKVEERLRKFVRKYANDKENLKRSDYNRAKRGFNKIKDYLIGDKILDLGAGNGLIGLEIKNQLDKEVILVDVVDYNHTELPMILYNPNNPIPLSDEEFDTTILYTVLHHSNTPKHILKEAARLTKKRLVIKEASIREKSLRMTNSFFDWFYNRVIGDKDINVPLNFLKVEEWEKLLNIYEFKVIKKEYVGIDEPLVPEYHIFIIADKF